MKNVTVFLVIFTLSLVACAPIIPATGVPTPFEITAEVSTAVAAVTSLPPGTEFPTQTSVPPTPIPTLPSSTLSPTELKYKVLEQFPDFFFCDPDFYPIARGDEMDMARQRFSEIQSNQEEFQTILNHNALSDIRAFNDEQKLLIYREHKKLNAIYFELVGNKFQFQIQTGSEGQEGFVIKGMIDGNGSIDVLQRDPGFPSCPICLAAGTFIDTPQGFVRVENLQVGDSVWTMNASGKRVQAAILQTGRVVVPASHQMVHIVLRDGRELWASAGHPTADGRLLGDLKVNDLLDGAPVTLVERLPYYGIATYDILPSGDTGFYWANGILMGSTLAEQ
jgi:hypothetical protein